MTFESAKQKIHICHIENQTRGWEETGSSQNYDNGPEQTTYILDKQKGTGEKISHQINFT